jgi:uncharacterized membrane protein YuzA (DUF378 family)
MPYSYKVIVAGEKETKKIEYICWKFNATSGHGSDENLYKKIEYITGPQLTAVMVAFRHAEHHNLDHTFNHHAKMEKAMGFAYGGLNTGYITFYTYKYLCGKSFQDSNKWCKYTSLIILFAGAMGVMIVYFCECCGNKKHERHQHD